MVQAVVESSLQFSFRPQTPNENALDMCFVEVKPEFNRISSFSLLSCHTKGGSFECGRSNRRQAMEDPEDLPTAKRTRFTGNYSFDLDDDSVLSMRNSFLDEGDLITKSFSASQDVYASVDIELSELESSDKDVNGLLWNDNGAAADEVWVEGTLNLDEIEQAVASGYTSESDNEIFEVACCKGSDETNCGEVIDSQVWMPSPVDIVG